MNSVNVKICGLTREKDAALAVSLGAWALGFILYEKSPRYIRPARLQDLLSSLGRVDSRKVAVFVNPSLSQVEAAATAGVDSIQLHGFETPDFCFKVKAQFPQLTLIKAFRLSEFQANTEALYEKLANYFLVDSGTEGEWGGTGRTLDFEKVRTHPSVPLLLAGGLTAENVKDAISVVKPFGVDLSSGVEDFPGIKSEERVRAFFKALKKD